MCAVVAVDAGDGDGVASSVAVLLAQAHLHVLPSQLVHVCGGERGVVVEGDSG